MSDTIPLGEIIKIRKGKKAPLVFDECVNGALPYLQIDEVRGKRPSKYAEDPKGVEVRPDDLCIVWDGANAGTVGYGVTGLIGSTVARMRLIEPTKWDTRFLGRLLEGKFQELNDQAQARGATIPHVDKNKLEEIALPKLDRDEQSRTAAILDKADVIRRKREQVLTLADDLLKSVFLEMFGDPATNPKRLSTAPIKKLGDVVTGNTPPRSNPKNYGDGIEWIKSDNINTPGHYLTAASERLSAIGEQICRKVPCGATLVTCIAGSPDCIGNAAMAEREVAFNQQINAVIPGPETDKHFLYGQILVAKRLIQRASTNSMKGMVSKGRFQEIEFLAPDPNQQARFGEIFQKILESNSAIEVASIRDQELFASLSQRAVRGEL